jgi:PAS domain S-box-containing protein
MDVEDTDARREREKLVPDGVVDESELRKLIEASTDLLAITTYDGYFTLLNKAWEFALGYTRDELRSRPFLEFVHPDDRDKTTTIAERIQPGVNLVSFQNRYIAKDGRVVPLRWRGLVSTERGRYYTAAQEMTEVLGTRAQLAALDALCELAAPAVLIQDAAGLVTRWEGGGEALFGWSANELVGQPLAEFLSRRRSGEPVELLALLSDGSDERRIPAQFRCRDGSTQDVLLAAREFGDGATPVTGVAAFISRVSSFG